MVRLPPLAQPLADEYVALRDTAERDIPEILLAHQDDPELHIRIGLERPPSGAQLGRGVEQEAAERVGRRSAQLTVLEPGSDRFRGQLTVHRVDPDHARAELGVWLVPQARGRGLGRRALRLACNWLVDVCGLERVELVTEPDNDPMLVAARAAGFSYEGVLHSYLRERGRRLDAAILSLLPSDLEAA
jgi:[ribosomal protein S5]-alanine N-acetyltransferase